MRAFVVVVLLLCSAGRADVDLGIAPVQQATPVWCWLAVGEMVFRKFDVPAVNAHYQCGVIGAISIASNQAQCALDCRKCNFPAGDATRLMGMLIGYPRRATMLTGQLAPRLFVTHTNTLSPDEVRRELDGGRPILAGINPSGRPVAFGASAHVALIEGYAEREGALILIVNDPFPFSPSTWADPYQANGATRLAPGQYGIPYEVYVNQLGWAESFLVRRDGMHALSPLQCFASTPLSQQRCPASLLAKPGERCQCGAVAGVVVDAG
ncbi:MAG: hypothetical protein Q8O67_06555 [Deltaproteobacteria bacterium]|nr:hypothetical protein [Deltaproteobacteria bacterium]